MREILLSILLIMNGYTILAQSVEKILFYNTAESQLTTAHKDSLDQWTENKKVSSIIIEGHTDSVGTDKYNNDLARNRAWSVKQYFTLKRIDDVLIQTSFHGELKPKNKARLDENRRVELRIAYITAEVLVENDISDFYKTSTLPLQEFCIDPNKDTILICEKGTVINIKANSFKLDGLDPATIDLGDSFNLSQLSQRQGVKEDLIYRLLPKTIQDQIRMSDLRTALADSLYSGYIKKQDLATKRVNKHDKLKVPQEFKFKVINGLSNEMIERLERARPQNFGQVRKVTGITPVALSTVLVHLTASKN